MSVLSILFNRMLGQISLAEHEAFFWFGLLVSLMTEFCNNTAITSLSLPLIKICFFIPKYKVKKTKIAISCIYDFYILKSIIPYYPLAVDPSTCGGQSENDPSSRPQTG